MSNNDGLILFGVGVFVLFAVGGGVLLTNRLNITDLQQLATDAGFGSDANLAAAVAMAESSGNPAAIGDVNVPVTGSNSYGLWQINSHFHPEFGPNFQSLLDPAVNASAAYSIYQQAGFSFSPWSTYKNGAYLAFMS